MLGVIVLSVIVLSVMNPERQSAFCQGAICDSKRLIAFLNLSFHQANSNLTLTVWLAVSSRPKIDEF
jgi:hypothetical protein